MTDTDTEIDLAAEVKRLEAKLMEQWGWFGDNRRHPDESTRHEVFLRTLKRYMTTYDRWKRERPCP
jgi:predicted metal-dependent enzyme (double-stranded beta helix superfamily)